MPRNRRQEEGRARDKGGGSSKTVIRYRRHTVHPLEFRVRLVREVLEGQASPTEICAKRPRGRPVRLKPSYQQTIRQRRVSAHPNSCPAAICT